MVSGGMVAVGLASSPRW